MSPGSRADRYRRQGTWTYDDHGFGRRGPDKEFYDELVATRG